MEVSSSTRGRVCFLLAVELEGEAALVDMEMGVKAFRERKAESLDIGDSRSVIYRISERISLIWSERTEPASETPFFDAFVPFY